VVICIWQTRFNSENNALSLKNGFSMAEFFCADHQRKLAYVNISERKLTKI